LRDLGLGEFFSGGLRARFRGPLFRSTPAFASNWSISRKRASVSEEEKLIEGHCTVSRTPEERHSIFA
jgi:hypothetical protein